MALLLVCSGQIAVNVWTITSMPWAFSVSLTLSQYGGAVSTPFLTVVGDFILMGLIMLCVMKLHLHFPHSLKGLLFYIQTVYYTTEHFPITFWDVRKYVSEGVYVCVCVCVCGGESSGLSQMLYVASGLGLYFPYDFCLYPAMPALVQFGLKFIPPAVALVVAITSIVWAYVTRYSV